MDSEVFGGNTWIFDGEVVAAYDPTDFDGGSRFELVGFAVARISSVRLVVLPFY